MDSEDILDVLQGVWQTICNAYDVTADLPDLPSLFEGVDPNLPDQASARLVANMLAEVTESIGRFSPWYKQPAEAFGLVLVRDSATNRPQWVLSSDAIRQQQVLLRRLAATIRRHVSLILSVNLIGSMGEGDDPCVMAQCVCTPPHVILVNRSVLTGHEIRCDVCRQPFRVVEEDRWID